MRALAYNGLSTPYQRLAIRCALADLELPTDRVSVLHRDLFKQADVSWNDGRDLEGELCGMTKTQASSLLFALRHTPCKHCGIHEGAFDMEGEPLTNYSGRA